MEYLYKKTIIPAGGSITGEHGIGKVKGVFLDLNHEYNIIDHMLNYHALKDVDSSFIDHCPRGDGSYTISRSVTSRGSRGR